MIDLDQHQAQQRLCEQSQQPYPLGDSVWYPPSYASPLQFLNTINPVQSVGYGYVLIVPLMFVQSADIFGISV